MLDTVRARHVVKKDEPIAFIHTAAASQLGQMLLKLCLKENVTVVNLVRRESQAETLRALGATHVVVTSKEDWQTELKDMIKSLNIQIAFDAIAGEMSGALQEHDYTLLYITSCSIRQPPVNASIKRHSVCVWKT